jgi:predicted phage terminase large subunit-like protein
MMTMRREYRTEDVEDYFGQFWDRARNDFATFRQLKRQNMLWGWWTEEVARELQRFYRDLIEGRRPKLALMAPPQHGKSWTVWDFIAWIAGKHPNMKTIFASYSDDLGVECNRDLQRTIKSDFFKAIFPDTRIDEPGWACSNDHIEFVDKGGSFRNTTVNGPINGFRLDLGVIDDPMKGRNEANSKTTRDSTWAWFADDFYNRFAAKAGLLLVMTRWHVDDPLGRFLLKFGDEVRVLRYSAIAERDEERVFEGKRFVRQKGQPLFAELKPLDFLSERKKLVTEASWESLFQQNPIVVGGGELPIEKLNVLPYFDRSKIVHSIRYWDKAGTTNNADAAYTVGVLMHKLSDGIYVIEDVARGRWNALDREQLIKTLAIADSKTCKTYEIVVEQEPGSGGKESAENTIRNLAGFRVSADRVTGSKEVRAQPFAAQVQGGNVWLVAGPWVAPFCDECETWPSGRFKDQIDAAAGAFNKLTASTSYNLNYKQWAY